MPTILWNSELMKWEYRELQATAMSVDWSGNNVLLAGRKWLAIKQIEDDNSESIKKFPRYSKYDAAGVEWCQTQQGQRLCALASNQRVDVYHWRNGDLTLTNSLRGHTRVVSDTHFHRQDHNLIATCSIDTFTHIWDLRDPRKPALSFRAVAGASQVQWNKVTSHILATAHDGDIKIWDKRKVSSPVNYISAHLSKVHGVDWSPHHEYQLVTSSHDGNIKYFDVNNPRRPENIITTNFPVWRAIYTPFGSGLLTIGVGYGGVPRDEQAGVVGIWVGGTLTHRLVGHTDTVQTIVWRNNTAPANYQLITWGRDQTLRLWGIHPDLLRKCHHYLPEDFDADDDGGSDSSSLSSNTGSHSELRDRGQNIQMVKLSSQKPSRSLDEEFESVRDMANTVVTDMSLDARTCTVRTEKNGYVASLQVNFPLTTGIDAIIIPKFSWLSGTTIDGNTTIKILQAINKTAHQRLKHGQPCLLYCLRTLTAQVDQIPAKSKDESEQSKSSFKLESDGETPTDASVPFPRTCGAVWGGVSTLVVFNRPPHARRLSLKQDCGTPRSMASLSSLSSMSGPLSPIAPPGTSPVAAPYMHRHPSNSITTFYFQDRWKSAGRRTGTPMSRSRGSIPSMNSPRVVLYGADHLFPLNLTLAEKYAINNKNPVAMCEHNAEVSSLEGESDLQRAWLLTGLAAKSLEEQLQADRMFPNPYENMWVSCEDTASWAVHPLCCNLVQSLIQQYATCSNVQMAAMLACTFAVFNENLTSSSQSTISCSSYGNSASPYNTVHQLSELTSSEGWTMTRNTHNSCTDTPESTFSRTEEMISCVVDRSCVHFYNCLKRAYADILHRARLLVVRTEVMKEVLAVEKDVDFQCHSGLEIRASCSNCSNNSSTSRCNTCNTPSLLCSVCGQGVRGLSAACPMCRHGGHLSHVDWWFTTHDSCPTGCGCPCSQNPSMLNHPLI